MRALLPCGAARAGAGRAAAAVLAGLTTACAVFSPGPPVRQTHDPTADFVSYQSFALAPAPAAARNVPGYSDFTGRRIQERIAAALEARGLRRVEGAGADLLVRFQLEGQPRAELVEVGSPFPFRDELTSMDYVEGTLVIDLFDQQRGKLVWHGWGSTRIFESEPPDPLMDEVVDAVLARYPPPAAP